LLITYHLARRVGAVTLRPRTMPVVWLGATVRMAFDLSIGSFTQGIP
jgi:hypothetical protein